MTQPLHANVRFSLGGPLTPTVRLLIIINVTIFLLIKIAAIHPNEVYNILGLRPALVTQQRTFWQLITYLFLHDSTSWLSFHLIFNMLMLWWFGADIERAWGGKLFLRYYFLSGIAAGLLVVLTSWTSYNVTIGASGAIMALLLAFAMSYPNRIILVMFVLPMKAKYLVLVIALLEFFATVGSQRDNISHVAHLGGLLFGLLWFLYYSGRLQLPDLHKFMRHRRRRGRLRIVRPDQKKEEDENSSPTFH